MDEVLAITLTSLHQDMNLMDRVATNIANASTPGYKREVVAMRPFLEVMEQTATGGTGKSTDDPALISTSMQVLLDTRPGSVKVTGESLDLALTREGFFEVSTENGLAYTRQGNFTLDPRGRLVTAQGYPVMGKGGEIYLTTLKPVVDSSGNITEPNATTGPSATSPGVPFAQIKVVTFENAKEMERLGDGLYSPGADLSVVADGNINLRQGALENSNVTSLQEMLQMLQTARHFESMQKISQGYDEMLGLAIMKLGDLS